MENTKIRGFANRGFASMPPEQQKAIASKGGKSISENRAHMAEIGSKGGLTASINRKRNKIAQAASELEQ